MEPKELPLKIFKKSVVAVLKSDMAPELSAEEINKFEKSVTVEFQLGKRIEHSDIEIRLYRVNPPYILLEVHNKSVFRQTGGASQTEPTISIVYMKSMTEAVVVPNDKPYTGTCSGFNSYIIEAINPESPPSLVLYHFDHLNGRLGCLRVVTPKGPKFTSTELTGTLHPIGKPASVNPSKCPGQQYSHTVLPQPSLGTCKEFRAERINHYWDCPKLEVEKYEFNCKTNLFERTDTIWR